MIVDANTWLGHWPFGEVRPATASDLVAHQSALGIGLSAVAPLDALYYHDPRPANDRLLRELHGHPALMPVAVINPTLGNWRHELARLARCVHQVRLLPGYHQYALDAPCVDTLVRAAGGEGLRVSVQLRVEDERAHHPLAQVPPVPVADLQALADRHPETSFLILGAYLGEALALATRPNLRLELSHVETLDTLDALLERVPAEQVMFGSHTPLLVTAAAVAKLELCRAPSEAVEAVGGGTFRAWLGPVAAPTT